MEPAPWEVGKRSLAGTVEREPGERIGRRRAGDGASFGLSRDVVEPQRPCVLGKVTDRPSAQLHELLEVLEEPDGKIAPVLGPPDPRAEARS